MFPALTGAPILVSIIFTVFAGYASATWSSAVSRLTEHAEALILWARLQMDGRAWLNEGFGRDFEMATELADMQDSLAAQWRELRSRAQHLQELQEAERQVRRWLERGDPELPLPPQARELIERSGQLEHEPPALTPANAHPEVTAGRLADARERQQVADAVLRNPRVRRLLRRRRWLPAIVGVPFVFIGLKVGVSWTVISGMILLASSPVFRTYRLREMRADFIRRQLRVDAGQAQLDAMFAQAFDGLPEAVIRQGRVSAGRQLSHIVAQHRDAAVDRATAALAARVAEPRGELEAAPARSPARGVTSRLWIESVRDALAAGDAAARGIAGLVDVRRRIAAVLDDVDVEVARLLDESGARDVHHLVAVLREMDWLIVEHDRLAGENGLEPLDADGTRGLRPRDPRAALQRTADRDGSGRPHPLAAADVVLQTEQDPQSRHLGDLAHEHVPNAVSLDADSIALQLGAAARTRLAGDLLDDTTDGSFFRRSPAAPTGTLVLRLDRPVPLVAASSLHELERAQQPNRREDGAAEQTSREFRSPPQPHNGPHLLRAERPEQVAAMVTQARQLTAGPITVSVDPNLIRRWTREQVKQVIEQIRRLGPHALVASTAATDADLLGRGAARASDVVVLLGSAEAYERLQALVADGQ